MSRSLGVLTLDLIAKTSGFVEGLSKAERATAKSNAKMQKDLEKLGKAGLALGAAFVAGAAAMVASSIKMADESRKLAQAVGLTTEGFTGLSWAMSQSGVSQEAFSTSMKTLNKSISDTSQGIGGTNRAFKNLGISVKDSSGQLKGSEQIINEIANAFQKMPDGIQKSAAAAEIFGKSGGKLIPLLNSGEAGIKGLTDQAERLGLVISDDTARKAELFNDSLNVMTVQLRGTANLVMADFLPIMSEMADAFAKNADESGGVTTAADKATSAIKALAHTGVFVASVFEQVGSAIGGVAALLMTIPQGWGAVRTMFKVVQDDMENTTDKYVSMHMRIAQIGKEVSETAAQDIKAIIENPEVAAAFDDALAKRLETLRESFFNEEQLLLQKFENEQETLRLALEQKQLTEEEFQELSTASRQRYQDSMNAIDRAGFQERMKLTQQALSNLSTLMNGQSRKLFEVGKAAALANAIISGHESAVEAYKGGLKVSGGMPAVGAAFAAASLAATGVQIQAINSTSFGGGKSGGGASATSAINAASEPVRPQQQQPTQNINIHGIDPNQMFSGQQMIDLLNNEIINGGRINVHG